MFKEQLEELKKPKTELSGFGTEEMRDIDQALAILTNLKSQAFIGGKDVALSKLRNAAVYLKNLQEKMMQE